MEVGVKQRNGGGVIQRNGGRSETEEWRWERNKGMVAGVKQRNGGRSETEEWRQE